MKLVDELVNRRGLGSFVTQVVDDPTPVPVSDEPETGVETVVHHTVVLSTEGHQLKWFSP
ncbi:hypothetical protein [Salinigranum halophilum]|uniref:hypothetical protein n=1 Tax=Salinigranum halophilum TaxID=2565931 RepID=UPI00137547BD|nr:hypothetical protein [Salinigranum halophilum]